MSETEYKQNNVSAVVWRWQDPPAEKASRHNRKDDVIKGLVGLAIGGSAAAYLYFKKEHVVAATVVASISGTISCCALFIPPAFAKIDAFFNRGAHYVGQFLAYVLLVPLFYLFFVPAHLLMAMTGKDKLKLKYPSKQPTFWEPRPKVEDTTYYRKQF